MTSGTREPSDEAWSKATRIARELDRILDGQEPMWNAVARAASELRLSTRQVYNHLSRYRAERRVSSLLPKTNGARRARISPAVEEIIAETLRDMWLRPEQPDLSPIVEEIRARCASEKLDPPAYVTVAKRIPHLFTPEEIARKRHTDGSKLRRLKARPGYIRAKHALDVVQIDHTPADIQFVDVIDGQGLFVGRPYLTIAADVATSAIIGFCLTLEHPSRLSVALCLAQTMCEKEDWMAERDIDHAWPMYGRPRKIVVDSAMEFRSASFARGCAEYGIAIETRNKGTVHRGGVVERLLGKVNTVLRSLPGKTGRSIVDRDDYPSGERARLSFADLERCITLAIIDHNLSQNARKLTVPADEWVHKRREAIAPADTPIDVLLNFLPNKSRRISPQGISLFAIDYFDPWLGPLIARRDRLDALDIRYDPRDVSHIYLKDPETGAWRPVGRRDGVSEPITLWQHKAERSRMRTSGQRPIEDKTVIRREIAATVEASASKKRRLRDLTRSKHATEVPKPSQSLSPSPAPAREGPNPNRPKRVFSVEDW